MMNLTREDLRALTSEMGYGGKFQEGVIIPHFNLLELAAALEGQALIAINKVTLHMDKDDAIRLAKVFRKLDELR